MHPRLLHGAGLGSPLRVRVEARFVRPWPWPGPVDHRAPRPDHGSLKPPKTRDSSSGRSLRFRAGSLADPACSPPAEGSLVSLCETPLPCPCLAIARFELGRLGAGGMCELMPCIRLV